MLPKDFPNWSTTHYYYRRWRIEGLWESIESLLREQVRVLEGKESTPSLLIADSQSVKTSFVLSEDKGYDGNKRVKGRKRHIACDTLGLPWTIAVTAANIGDRDGIFEAIIKLLQTTLPRLQKIIFDQGYIGEAFLWLISSLLGCKAEVVFRKEKDFQVLNEEPASELLKIISNEKEKLVKEAKIKKQATLPEISEDEKPFELPIGWCKVSPHCV